MLEDPPKFTQAHLFKQPRYPKVPRSQPRFSPDQLQKSRVFDPAFDLLLITRESEEDSGLGRRHPD